MTDPATAPPATRDLEIRTASTDSERSLVYRYRYQVYVEEMGKTIHGADHARRVITDPVDEFSTLLYVTDGQTVQATLRLTWLDQGQIPDRYRQYYALNRFDERPARELALASRLMLNPEHRGSVLLGRLLVEGYRVARERGCQFVFCDCAPALVQLYEQLGFRRYKDNVYDPDTGLKIALVLVTEDVAHLRRCASPLWRLARDLDNDPGPAEWFARKFPPRISYVPARLKSEEDLWYFMSTRLYERDIPLFAGLSDDEISRFLKAGTIIKCRRGDRIIRAGEVGHEMFLLLSGAAEVRFRQDGRDFSLATFGRGQIFGEMAFLTSMPRTADVVAMTDLEVMVINQQFLHKITKTTPTTANQVLFNLNLVLCERLRMTTSRLAAAQEEAGPGGEPA
ncbi:MAG: cyclic nucleotide-binding domain-containing protein [Proteobacteria bacterium]|nr:cyclic nucleotide-binding domain-containing protein [Pseudomonadota bacterium]